LISTAALHRLPSVRRFSPPAVDKTLKKFDEAMFRAALVRQHNDHHVETAAAMSCAQLE
jgi:hypothetical protein